MAKKMTAKEFAKATDYRCKTHNYEKRSNITIDMISNKNGGPMLFEDAEATLEPRWPKSMQEKQIDKETRIFMNNAFI